MLLISLPIGPYFRKAWNDEIFFTGLMQGFGSAFLVFAAGYFIMNYLLRKRNRDGNFKGVKKMLTVICTISAVITILVYSALSFGLLVIIVLGGFFLPYHFYLIFLIPALVLWCLLLHGIRKGRSGFKSFPGFPLHYLWTGHSLRRHFICWIRHWIRIVRHFPLWAPLHHCLDIPLRVQHWILRRSPQHLYGGREDSTANEKEH